jgi:hypothetical protein
MSVANPQCNIWQVTDEKVQEMVHLAKHQRVRDKHCQAVQELLNALPLTIVDYLRLTNHLVNARRYFHCQELGAATYELNLLRGILRTQLPPPSSHSRNTHSKSPQTRHIMPQF